MADCEQYEGTNYDTAVLYADICTYNYGVELLNNISTQFYEVMEEAAQIANEVADLKSRSRALALLGNMDASIGLYWRAHNLIASIEPKIVEATALIGSEDTHNFLSYSPYRNPATGYYEGAIAFNNRITYQEGISFINDKASGIEDFSSWSFSFNIGTSGDTSFRIGVDTYNTLVNLTLQGANDIGLIQDSTYEKITMSPLWQMGLTAVASMGVSYGMTQLGYTKTPFGNYMDNATYKEMFTSDVMDVFEAINTINTLYDAYSTYKEYKDLKDTKESISEDASARELRDYADTGIYASGDYYKFFAGQKLFNVGMAGHESYVPASAQIPSWGIVKENLHTEDSFTSMIMNQNRNASMAGGSSFLSTITDGVLKNKI